MNNKKNDISKNMVDKSGAILKNEKSNKDDREKSLEILSEWRYLHNYPLQIFKRRLKRVSEKLDKNSLSSQRLKRVPSIIKKLKRKYQNDNATMKLTQIQDIAGCRVVLSNMELVKKLYNEDYIKGHIKHELVNKKDYIKNPKNDGYRSIHLIYKYKSDKENKKKYNGLLVEIQIRSKLQHLWATAVETVDFFTNQAIKSNEGKKKWVDFFRLVSSAFAIMEDSPLIPNTEMKEKRLYSEIKKKEKEMNIIFKMTQWRKSMRIFDEIQKTTKGDIFLLELDISQEKLTITNYFKSQEKEAIQDYSIIEKKIYGKKEYDVVLVGADNIMDLRKAYPNYFLDTEDFIVKLKKIIKKAD